MNQHDFYQTVFLRVFIKPIASLAAEYSMEQPEDTWGHHSHRYRYSDDFSSGDSLYEPSSKKGWWDCYFVDWTRPLKSKVAQILPQTMQDFLACVNNPEEVVCWFEKPWLSLNLILCCTGACMGAEPYISYHHIDQTILYAIKNAEGHPENRYADSPHLFLVYRRPSKPVWRWPVHLVRCRQWRATNLANHLLRCLFSPLMKEAGWLC